MNRLVAFTALVLMAFSSCKDDAQTQEPVAESSQPEVSIDKQYRPLLHLFTSTNCGGCGRFGIPVFSTVAEEMGDSILALPTHFKYEDPYINETSLAIEKAIVQSYHSPQIWVNEKEITYTILPYSLANAQAKTKELLREQLSKEPEAYVGLEYKFKSNGRYEVRYAVERNAATKQRLLVEVYAMEDGLIASQAGADPYVATHYRVNRGGYYGKMGTVIPAEVGGITRKTIEVVPCWNCSATDLYFYIVVWRELSGGRYEYVNGKVVK
ncbi:MAG: hypothetical protein H6608_03760 [Flavobacteriales bacterium]|nr:hypothetical protein [Flavobacteriales bacterium]